MACGVGGGEEGGEAREELLEEEGRARRLLVSVYWMVVVECDVGGERRGRGQRGGRLRRCLGVLYPSFRRDVYSDGG